MGINVVVVSLLGPIVFAAATPFSPVAIYNLPDRSYIDDRCHNARAFADRAAKSVDDIDAATAIQAAGSFSTCMNLPRLNPDENAQRYLYLAAATALYVAATKNTGEQAASLLREVDAMARNLGATGADHTVVIEHVVQTGRPNSPGNPMPVNPTHEYDVIERSPFGAAHAGRFTDEANELLTAVGDEASRQNARPQAAGDPTMHGPPATGPGATPPPGAPNN